MRFLHGQHSLFTLSYIVTQEGFSFLLGEDWKWKRFRFGSACAQNNEASESLFAF